MGLFGRQNSVLIFPPANFRQGPFPRLCPKFLIQHLTSPLSPCPQPHTTTTSDRSLKVFPPSSVSQGKSDLIPSLCYSPRQKKSSCRTPHDCPPPPSPPAGPVLPFPQRHFSNFTPTAVIPTPAICVVPETITVPYPAIPALWATAKAPPATAGATADWRTGASVPISMADGRQLLSLNPASRDSLETRCETPCFDARPSEVCSSVTREIAAEMGKGVSYLPPDRGARIRRG